MSFFSTLRQIKWDLTSRRFLHFQALISWVPSRSGYMLRNWYYRKWLKSLGEETVIGEKTYIRNPHKLSIGSHCSIGYENIFQCAGGLTIGDWVIFGPCVRIWTSNHRFDDPSTPIYNQGQDFREVIIEDDCWLGANVFIMPGAHLSKGSVVSAGAVVGGKKFPEYAILAGNPARVIGYRTDRAPAAVKPAGEETPSAQA